MIVSRNGEVHKSDKLFNVPYLRQLVVMLKAQSQHVIVVCTVLIEIHVKIRKTESGPLELLRLFGLEPFRGF